MAGVSCTRSILRSASRGIWLLLLLGFLPAIAQVPKARLKPTELVVKRYERFILTGYLLTSEGWKLASGLFTKADPYPQNGEIQVMWTGTNTLGEEWNNGSRAQVNTKWNDFYGTIDSSLRFKPGRFGTVPMAESFSLVFVPLNPNVNGKTDTRHGATEAQWKIDSPLRVRSASIHYAIKYLEGMRDRSSDPAIRRNAQKTIDSLKRIRHGCGIPNPC